MINILSFPKHLILFTHSNNFLKVTEAQLDVRKSIELGHYNRKTKTQVKLFYYSRAANFLDNGKTENMSQKNNLKNYFGAAIYE